MVAIDAPTASTLKPTRNITRICVALPSAATALSPMRLAISVDTTLVSMCSDCSAKIGHASLSRPGSGTSASGEPGNRETVDMGRQLSGDWLRAITDRAGMGGVDPIK